MNVKITASGVGGLTARVADAETGENIPKCYAYEVMGDVYGVNRATVFCYATSVDVVADAEVIEVSDKLLERAESVAREFNSPIVDMAIGKLLGRTPKVNCTQFGDMMYQRRFARTA